VHPATGQQRDGARVLAHVSYRASDGRGAAARQRSQT
jgi:hypothetical protein